MHRGSRRRHGETFGLHDSGGRYYAAPLSQFISADPIVPGRMNPQALNRYSYVFNNPLRYTDPSGHDPFEDGPWWTEYCQHSNAAPSRPTSIGKPTYSRWRPLE